MQQIQPSSPVMRSSENVWSAASSKNLVQIVLQSVQLLPLSNGCPESEKSEGLVEQNNRSQCNNSCKGWTPPTCSAFLARTAATLASTCGFVTSPPEGKRGSRDCDDVKRQYGGKGTVNEIAGRVSWEIAGRNKIGEDTGNELSMYAVGVDVRVVIKHRRLWEWFDQVHAAGDLGV